MAVKGHVDRIVIVAAITAGTLSSRRIRRAAPLTNSAQLLCLEVNDVRHGGVSFADVERLDERKPK